MLRKQIKEWLNSELFADGRIKHITLDLEGMQDILMSVVEENQDAIYKHIAEESYE